MTDEDRSANRPAPSQESSPGSSPATGTVVVHPPGSQVTTAPPLPCRHGCTCRLHDQVTLAVPFDGRRPEDVDHGEMRALVDAAIAAQQRLDGFHDALRLLRERVQAAGDTAGLALDRLASLLRSQRLVLAAEHRERVRGELKDLEADQLRLPGRGVRVAGVLAIAAIMVFDVLFFYQNMSDILGMPTGTSGLFSATHALPGGVLAVGIVMSGKVLAGPFWRLSRRLRASRPRSGRWIDRARAAVPAALAVLAFPLALFGVLALWAGIRGAMANDPDYFPPPWALTVLLLALALTALVIEVMLANPFAKQWHEAQQQVLQAHAEYERLREAATTELTAFETAWRDMRSARDEVLALVRIELQRPWQDLILPARFIHGVAGPVPPQPQPLTLVPSENAEAPGHKADDTVAEITRLMQIYQDVAQPVPALGPLAEVTRQLRDRTPRQLAARRTQLVNQLDAQLGAPPKVQVVQLPRDEAPNRVGGDGGATDDRGSAARTDAGSTASAGDQP